MNTSIKTILAVVAMGATAIAAQAQTIGQPATPRVVTIDLGKALNGYYRTQEETAKLQAIEQNANKTAEGIVAEGQAMAEKFKAAQATLQSPVATDIAKQQATADAQRIYGDMQKKQQEFDNFRQNAVQQIQQGVAATRQQLIKEIVDKATEIGKGKGANVILDRGSMVYADTGMEITDEVLAQLNKGHPVTPPAATPAATPATGATPAVGYPGTGR